jgi:hypothetical protein
MRRLWFVAPETASDKPGTYAWLTLAALMDEQTSVQEVADKHPFAQDTDYVTEFRELARALFVLEANRMDLPLETRLADLLVGMIASAVDYIRANNNDYPSHGISAKIWMDGAALREICQLLVSYHLRKELTKQALDMAYYKARVTLGIMAHYPYEVGPDMVQLGQLCEQTEAPDAAQSYYQAVVNDFLGFLQDYERWPVIAPTTYSPDANEDVTEPLSETDRTTLQALIDACQGLIRLGMYTEHSTYIRRAEAVLDKHSFD